MNHLSITDSNKIKSEQEHKGHNDDYVYFNLRMFNSNLTENIVARFIEERTIPILDKTNDYKLAVEKFVIPAINIPIMLMVSNKYSITLRYNGADYQTFLIWVPNSNTPDQQFFIWTWSEIVTTVNIAFQTAFNNLIFVNPAAANTAPFITFNPTTQLFSILAENGKYFPENPIGIQIFMNTALYQKFLSWDSFSNLAATNGKNNLILLKNRNYTNQLTLNLIQYNEMTQDFVSLYSFNEFVNIIFKTSLIPVSYEQQAGANGTIYGSGDPNFVSVITDFSPVLSDNSVSNRSYLQYVPQIRRWYNLTHGQPLRKIDLSIFYQLNSGQELPLMLAPNTYIQIKILFQKKYI